ncbi:hypothetical protein [Sinorhizobium meliloti]|uniref:hypothetical protein n=1 Tax=Rhizobium meliloti TaxID=382 RepID=UPI0013E39CD0|nr:hypothetical protein [Sinorhizobium meliloti]
MRLLNLVSAPSDTLFLLIGSTGTVLLRLTHRSGRLVVLVTILQFMFNRVPRALGRICVPPVITHFDPPPAQRLCWFVANRAKRKMFRAAALTAAMTTVGAAKVGSLSPAPSRQIELERQQNGRAFLLKPSEEPFWEPQVLCSQEQEIKKGTMGTRADHLHTGLRDADAVAEQQSQC